MFNMNSNDTTLYHYCTTDAFESIIKNRSLRLSSLLFTNDYNEGKILEWLFNKLADEEQLDHDLWHDLANEFRTTEEIIDSVAFCLSQAPDLLSQWRGYAGNGEGIAIGFSMEYLERFVDHHQEQDPLKWPISLEPVIYSYEEMEKVFIPLYKTLLQIKKLERTGLENATEEFIDTAFEAHREMSKSRYRIKNEGFSEEQEWRMVAQYAFTNKNYDVRSKGSALVPCIELELIDLDIPIINKVIMGPKHNTHLDVMRTFLKFRGFPDVDVTYSRCSYQ